MFKLPGALPDNFFNKTHYPKAVAWQERYNAAITKAAEESPKPTELLGTAAVNKILDSKSFEQNLKVDEDPSGHKAGDMVEVFPTDTGFTRRDTGKLVGLTTQEVVISVVSQQDGKEVHINFPRWNFSIETRTGNE